MTEAKLAPCFVLHRRAYRETSLLVEAFSSTYGRVGLIARGVRQKRSRWTGLLEPFQPLWLSWRGRGELGTLTTIESPVRLQGLRGGRLYAGFYINELLMRLTVRNDPAPELYDGYDAAIRHLSAHGPEGPILRVFEKQLLASIGYGVITDFDVDNGEQIRSDKYYDYLPEVGPTSKTNGQGCRVSGKTLLALARDEFADENTLRESKLLMRTLLARHLGERPLETRILYSSPP